jgi:hypothetical protein
MLPSALAKARIVIADQDSPWRSLLVQGLEPVEPALRVTETGHELRRALEEVADPPRIVVVGQGLRGIGGLEALYQAERTLHLERKSRPVWPVRTVSLVTDVRSDAELLDIFRRRGATHFIYREDPIERTIAALLANLKPAIRAMVRIDAEARFEGQTVPGAVYDLSRTGASLVLASDRVPRVPLVGSKLELSMTFRSVSLGCEAEVRGLTMKNGSQGNRLVLGLHFGGLSSGVIDDLERVIREAAEEFEMVHEGAA